MESKNEVSKSKVSDGAEAETSVDFDEESDQLILEAHMLRGKRLEGKHSEHIPAEDLIASILFNSYIETKFIFSDLAKITASLKDIAASLAKLADKGIAT